MLKKRLLQKLNKYLQYRTTLSESEKEKLIQSFLAKYPPCLKTSSKPNKKHRSSLGAFSYEDFLESEFSGFLEQQFHSIPPHLEIPWNKFTAIFNNPPDSLIKVFVVYQKKYNLDLTTELLKLEKEIKKMYHFQQIKKFNFPLDWYPHSKVEVTKLAEYWATNIFSKMLKEKYEKTESYFWHSPLDTLKKLMSN